LALLAGEAEGAPSKSVGIGGGGYRGIPSCFWLSGNNLWSNLWVIPAKPKGPRENSLFSPALTDPSTTEAAPTATKPNGTDATTPAAIAMIPFFKSQLPMLFRRFFVSAVLIKEVRASILQPTPKTHD
jgi:hypothetical protein